MPDISSKITSDAHSTPSSPPAFQEGDQFDTTKKRVEVGGELKFNSALEAEQLIFEQTQGADSLSFEQGEIEESSSDFSFEDEASEDIDNKDDGEQEASSDNEEREQSHDKRPRHDLAIFQDEGGEKQQNNTCDHETESAFGDADFKNAVSDLAISPAKSCTIDSTAHSSGNFLDLDNTQRKVQLDDIIFDQADFHAAAVWISSAPLQNTRNSSTPSEYFAPVPPINRKSLVAPKYNSKPHEYIFRISTVRLALCSCVLLLAVIFYAAKTQEKLPASRQIQKFMTVIDTMNQSTRSVLQKRYLSIKRKISKKYQSTEKETSSKDKDKYSTIESAISDKKTSYRHKD